jgi:hypothetical protein
MMRSPAKVQRFWPASVTLRRPRGRRLNLSPKFILREEARERAAPGRMALYHYNDGKLPAIMSQQPLYAIPKSPRIAPKSA